MAFDNAVYARGLASASALVIPFILAIVLVRRKCASFTFSEYKIKSIHIIIKHHRYSHFHMLLTLIVSKR